MGLLLFLQWSHLLPHVGTKKPPEASGTRQTVVVLFPTPPCEPVEAEEMKDWNYCVVDFDVPDAVERETANLWTTVVNSGGHYRGSMMRALRPRARR